MSNGPVELKRGEQSLRIRLTAKGMQNIRLYSPETLRVKGESLRIERDGPYYEVTQFGEEAEIEVYLK